MTTEGSADGVPVGDADGIMLGEVDGTADNAVDGTADIAADGAADDTEDGVAVGSGHAMGDGAGSHGLSQRSSPIESGHGNPVTNIPATVWRATENPRNDTGQVVAIVT